MRPNDHKKGFIQHSVCRRCYTGNGKLSAGFTLFYAVLTASLLLAIGIAIFNITYKELILSSGARESTSAFYAADTGLECALFWDLKHTGLSSPAFGFYGDSLASGLVGYWRFEDGSGSLIAVDSSGSGKTGVLTSMSATSSWISGKIDDALLFDGINDRVVAPVAPVTGSANRTVAFWVRPTALIAAESDHLVEWGGPGNGGRYTIKLDPGNFVRVEISGANFVSALAAPPGVWSFVAVVMNGSTLGSNTIYVNSSSQGATGAAGINTGNVNGANIGGSYAFVDRYFAGAIDDVRIYNRALSAAEIQKLSTSPYSNPTFVQPVVEGSNAQCLGADITNPATGWDSTSGWTVATTTTSASTTFDILLPNDRCATVDVLKNTSTTTIISRGYSTCDLESPRRVERAIRAEY